MWERSLRAANRSAKTVQVYLESVRQLERFLVTIPGSRAAVWTGEELLTLGTVSGTESAANPGPGQESRPDPHIIGLRFGT